MEPKFQVPERPSKLDPSAEKLSGWLRIEAGKSRKQKRTAKQMHADLVALGYGGSYGRVAVFVRAWKADRQREAQTSGRGTFVPLVFAPGEAFQFDWSEDWAVLGGERVKLQVAHTKLSHSRAFIVRAYPLQTHEMLFDALTQAFRVLGGVPRRGIFDNMKTAVDRIGTGKSRQVNARFAAMASHYLFEPEFCNPASGWEKGQVEKNVQDARRRPWQPLPSFPDLDALGQTGRVRRCAFRADQAQGGETAVRGRHGRRPGRREGGAKAVPLYAELAAMHMADAELHQRSYSTTEGYMRVHVVPRWGRVRLTDIDSRSVARWLASKRDEGLAPATVVKIRAIFSRSFELGARWGVAGCERNRSAQWRASRSTTRASATSQRRRPPR